MEYRIIPMETYPRRAHFAYFSTMAQPYAGVTVSVEITHFLESVQEKGSPFFHSFLYCVSRAANQVPELRQRIWKGEIIEYQNCPTSHTVALPDGTYCYCMLRSEKPFQEYLPEAVQAQEAAKRRQSLEDGTEEESLPLLFVSSLPWITYDGIVQPTPSPADSNPRITWGRYRREGTRAFLPVSLLCHHALVDGLHMARFYQNLEAELERWSG